MTLKTELVTFKVTVLDEESSPGVPRFFYARSASKKRLELTLRRDSGWIVGTDIEIEERKASTEL